MTEVEFLPDLPVEKGKNQCVCLWNETLVIMPTEVSRVHSEKVNTNRKTPDAKEE